jgi:hypothetical protein
MPKSKKLTKRQLAVLDALFTGRSEEQTVLKKHHVPRALYEKWLADERFAGLFEQRIEHAYRRSRIILARKAPRAAKQLVKLTSSKDEETARKACLDIITRQHTAGCTVPHKAPPVQEVSAPAADLSPETASRLLATLADSR